MLSTETKKASYGRIEFFQLISKQKTAFIAQINGQRPALSKSSHNKHKEINYFIQVALSYTFDIADRLIQTIQLRSSSARNLSHKNTKMFLYRLSKN